MTPLLSVRPLISLFSALTLAAATADLQVGAGAGVFTGTEYDEEIGYGLEGEFGYLSQGQPINLFIGVRASYVDGLASSGSVLNSKDSSDLDLFEGTLVGRVLIPLGADAIKIYWEGSVGSANLNVSGDAKIKGSVRGQDFSINSQFDESDWVLALGLGAGFQFDFTHNIGLRVGYNFHSFGDSEVFGLNLDPGSMNGITSSLIFKF
jgi:opacity protein-like surface antigen